MSKRKKIKEETMNEEIMTCEPIEIITADSLMAENTNEEPIINEDEILELAKKEGLIDGLAIDGEPVETESVTDDEINEKYGLSSSDQDFMMAGMETLLFMSDKPITLSKMRSTINSDVPLSVYRRLMSKLKEEFSRDMRGIEIAEISGGLQLRTKPQMAAILRKLVKVQPLKLTTTNLETLAVIAYKQPITKDMIDQIRGVDSGYMLRTLMEKRLVKIVGRSELPGKPMIYGTSHEFLELFNLKDLTSLPPLHEIESMVAASEVGAEDDDEKRLSEFGEMIETQSTNLFEVGGLDEEIESLRSEIAAVSTSTEYIDLQKQKEKFASSLNAPNLSDEKRIELEAKLSEVDSKILSLTSKTELATEIAEQNIEAQNIAAVEIEILQTVELNAMAQNIEALVAANTSALLEEANLPKEEIEAMENALSDVFA